MDITTLRSYIYHETYVHYLQLLDLLKVQHDDYTTQACLSLIFLVSVTTYLISIRWLSETLLSQDLDQQPQAPMAQAQAQPQPPNPTQKEVRFNVPTQPPPQKKSHSLPLKTLVYLSSATFFSLPLLYLHKHPPPSLPSQQTLTIHLRPLLHYIFFTLSAYILAIFFFATLSLYGFERFLFLVLKQLEGQRRRRIRLQGRDNWLDALDGSAVKAVREVHGLVRRMCRELVRVEMWGLPFRGWVWEPVWKGVRGWCGVGGGKVWK